MANIRVETNQNGINGPVLPESENSVASGTVSSMPGTVEEQNEAHTCIDEYHTVLMPEVMTTITMPPNLLSHQISKFINREPLQKIDVQSFQQDLLIENRAIERAKAFQNS